MVLRETGCCQTWAGTERAKELLVTLGSRLSAGFFRASSWTGQESSLRWERSGQPCPLESSYHRG